MLKAQLHLAPVLRQFQCCHEPRPRTQLRSEERTQSLGRGRNGLGEVTGDRAHFGSGVRMGFQEELTLEWVLQDLGSGRCFTCTGTTRTKTQSLEENACVGKLLVVQFGKCPGYPEGILGEGTGKGCEV